MIFLKATNKEAFEQAMIDAGWVTDDDEGNQVIAPYSPTHSVDIIGEIAQPTGNMITDEMTGQEVPEMAIIDGWHANVLLHGENLPEPLAAFEISAPATPVRRFA